MEAPVFSHSPSLGGQGCVQFFWQLIRAHQWWNYKIPLALAGAFAFAVARQIPFSALFLPSFLIVLTGFVSGVFASVINDFTDMAQDRAAGKVSNLARLSRCRQVLLLALALLFVLLIAALLAPLPVSRGLFALVCLMFAVYSLPPLRFKERGWLGAVCISMGEHVLPALLSLYLVAELCACTPSFLWLLALVGWSACFGLRGIIWHQLVDADNDRKAGCATLAVEMQAQSLNRIAASIIFPLECLCLLLLLFLMGNVFAWIALGLYAFLDYSRRRFMSANIIIVNPKPYARFVLFEYYQLLWPLSTLFSAIAADKAAVFLFAAFSGLFCVPLALSWHHIFHMAKFNWGRAALRVVAMGVNRIYRFIA